MKLFIKFVRYSFLYIFQNHFSSYIFNSFIFLNIYHLTLVTKPFYTSWTQKTQLTKLLMLFHVNVISGSWQRRKDCPRSDIQSQSFQVETKGYITPPIEMKPSTKVPEVAAATDNRTKNHTTETDIWSYFGRSTKIDVQFSTELILFVSSSFALRLN